MQAPCVPNSPEVVNQLSSDLCYNHKRFKTETNKWECSACHCITPVTLVRKEVFKSFNSFTLLVVDWKWGFLIRSILLFKQLMYMWVRCNLNELTEHQFEMMKLVTVGQTAHRLYSNEQAVGTSSLSFKF